MKPRIATHGVGVPADVDPGHLGQPGRRLEQRREDSERRRLAGAVRPDEPEDLALGDVEVEASDRDGAGVALDQAAGPDDPAHSTLPSSTTLNEMPTESTRSFTNRIWIVPVAGST